MPHLVIEQPGMPALTISVPESEIRLGRAEDNTVVLVADEVSRHHARIARRGFTSVLYDLNSMNGTYVNRQRVVERVLSHLDEIWFGSKCRLVYRDDTHVGADAPERRDSTLREDLTKIREEMDQLSSSLTLIGKRGRTPVDPGAGVPAQPPPGDLLKMSKAFRRLDALYRAGRLIASGFDLQKRLSEVLDTAIEVMDAERGFLMLRDEKGDLRVHVAREMGRDLEASSPSMGIAGQAAFDGEPVLMNQGRGEDPYALRESVIQQRITSAMGVPLRVDDRVLGSIYLDSRKPGHEFNEEDLELFASLAGQSAMAIENVRLHQRMLEEEKKRANLGRFLSPTIVDQVMKEESVLELGGHHTEVTTLFCDIRGFSGISERVPPSRLVDLLNEHFTAMTRVIFEFGGTLDKFIGDEVMAVFGAPLRAPDDPERAIRAALAMQQRTREQRAQRSAIGAPPFEVGIGICTGEVVAGYVGAPERMEFTVVGDRVNTARRLCAVAGPGQVIVAAATFERVKDLVDARTVGTVMLRGKQDPEQAYEVLRVKT